jgi:hypothetical protein
VEVGATLAFVMDEYRPYVYANSKMLQYWNIHLPKVFKDILKLKESR